MGDVRRVLLDLSWLLGQYGYEERSGFIADLADESDEELFWSTVSGLEFWGGSGAVWEVAPFQYTHASVESAADDYRRFQRLMIELADILDARGLAALAARNAAYFQRQLSEDG